MGALRSNFGVGLILAIVVTLVTAVSVVWAWRRGPREGRLPQALLLAGAMALVVVATALPRSWPPERDGWGDLVLGIGEGGLGDWRLLAQPLATLAAVELWTNVAVYVPLGAAAWLAMRSVPRAVAIGAGLSVAIETWQWAALSRVAAVDDVLLNVGGTLLGTVTAAGIVRVTAVPTSKGGPPR